MPLRDAHVLEDGSELGLVHGVEMHVRGAVASVLPGEVDNGAGEPDVAVDLRGTIVLCCCILIWANTGFKVRERVEGEDALERSFGEAEDVGLEGREHGCIVFEGWWSVPSTIVGNP